MSGRATLYRWAVALALAVTVGLGLAKPPLATAQIPDLIDTDFQMQNGVGWSAVLPDALLGLGAFHVFTGIGWGLYADGHLTHGSLKKNSEFLEDQSPALMALYPPGRIDRVGDDTEWLMFNAAVMKAITPHLAVGLGAGAARESVIITYLDYGPDALTPSGFVYVEDDTRSGWKANLVAKALIRTGSRIGWMVGLESAPRSLSLGVLLTFP